MIKRSMMRQGLTRGLSNRTEGQTPMPTSITGHYDTPENLKSTRDMLDDRIKNLKERASNLKHKVERKRRDE